MKMSFKTRILLSWGLALVASLAYSRWRVPALLFILPALAIRYLGATRLPQPPYRFRILSSVFVVAALLCILLSAYITFPAWLVASFTVICWLGFAALLLYAVLFDYRLFTTQDSVYQSSATNGAAPRR